MGNERLARSTVGSVWLICLLSLAACANVERYTGPPDLGTEGRWLNAKKTEFDQRKQILDRGPKGFLDNLPHRLRLDAYNAEVAQHNKALEDYHRRWRLADAAIPRLYPTTSGSHARNDGLVNGSPIERYVIWCKHSAVTQFLMGTLLGTGHTVVERAQMDRLLDEQRTTLQYASDGDADAMRVGRLTGATQVIFADVRTAPVPSNSGQTMSVELRSVHVESGTVRWVGAAIYNMPVPIPGDQAAVYAAKVALQRAICRIEAGWIWIDPTGAVGQGCVKNN